MNTCTKYVALIECVDLLETALNEITDIENDDEMLTAIWWELKDTIDSVKNYIEELGDESLEESEYLGA